MRFRLSLLLLERKQLSPILARYTQNTNTTANKKSVVVYVVVYVAQHSRFGNSSTFIPTRRFEERPKKSAVQRVVSKRLLCYCVGKRERKREREEEEKKRNFFCHR